MSVYIELLHGRNLPDEELDDWGYNGPVLGPFPFFHTTYNSDIKLGDEGIVIMGKQIEFPVWDKDDLIYFLGSYYGDMSIFGPEYIKKDLRKRHTRTKQVLRMPKDLRKRHTRTKQVLQMPIDRMPLLMSDVDDWVKNYAGYVMGGKL